MGVDYEGRRVVRRKFKFAIEGRTSIYDDVRDEVGECLCNGIVCEICEVNCICYSSSGEHGLKYEEDSAFNLGLV